jgi:hypothetical protein
MVGEPLGRLLDLGGTQAENNAFIMQIDEFLIVEFGAIGSACALHKFYAVPERVRVLLNGAGTNSWIGVACCWLVTISTDHITQTNEGVSSW